MNPIVTECLKHSKFNTLLKNIKNNEKNLSITGVTDSAKAHLIYALYNYSNISPVICCSSIASAKKMIQDLKFYSSNTEIIFLPAREITYYTVDSQSRETNDQRVYAINKIISGAKNCIFVTTIDALMQKMMPKSTYENLNVEIDLNTKANMQDIITSLNLMGYSRVELVESKGEYSVRGGIIDIYTIDGTNPYRIEFFGDDIDSIRTFDIHTQRSVSAVSNLSITYSNEYIISSKRKEECIEKLNELLNTDIDSALKETLEQDIDIINTRDVLDVLDKYYNLLVPDAVSLLDYFTSQNVVYIDEITKCRLRSKGVIEEQVESQKIMTEKCQIYPQYVCSNYSLDDLEQEKVNLSLIYVERINQDRILHAKRKEYSFNCREVNFFRSSMDIFVKETLEYLKQKRPIAMVFATDSKIETVKNLLLDNNIHAKYVQDITMLKEIKNGEIYISKGIISSGFMYNDDNGIVVFSEEISGIRKDKNAKSSKEFLGDILSSYEDLKVGDYVVHINHGIGQYLGIEQLDASNVTKDYIKLMYQDSGVLYIPVTSLDTIRKYVCEDGYVPKLNKLGTKDWVKTKEKVGKHVKDIAKDLVKLYAARANATGFAFSKDTSWQREFESDIEFELTSDQDRSITELKKDMEQEKPMDRLLCGDVGYGKTEVAIRGAFKAVIDQKQVAYLVPTTVLCLQQYKVFKERMEKYGVRVEMLCRFKTAKEQKEIIEELKNGTIDIIVGTHRVLSKDIVFKNLGMLIIDEEHRFGVEDKEKIKKYRNNIDVLSMTATPIPRTLHMSMIGIRDISVLLEPPLERLPVHTYVMEYNDDIISEAIQKELSRDGQVFYIYNRVEDIDNVVAKVQRLVPEAKIAFAHGRMTPNQIEDTMVRFIEHEIDILICTTLLESGIDIPNANTIIVENADRMGLAQLYQIRGRVGRSNRLSYAYITYRKSAVISEEASKRLQALKEYTEFGSGFKIALRDLEIRGAGNLLGSQQSGHMLSVGYDMYSALLEQAVQKEKQVQNVVGGDETSISTLNSQDDVKIIIDISANIPDSYIKDTGVKIAMYQKLSNAKNDEDLEDIMDELLDRFGDVPKVTRNLIEIIRIRNKARQIGIDEIRQKGNSLMLGSKYGENNIKYSLTNEHLRDILTYINNVLDKILVTLKIK